MELARVSKTNLNVSSEAELLSYTYSGGTPKEVIARADVGDGTHDLAGTGGTYTVKVYINSVLVVPVSQVSLPGGTTRAIFTSRSVAVSTGDVVSIRLTGQSGDTAVNTTTTLRNATPVLASDVTGDGSVMVDHNYGGADALAYKTSFGHGIDNATVRAYLRADYDAGNRALSYVIAQTTTDVAGRWVRSFMLDPGSYTLLFWAQGGYGPDAVNITVS